MHPALPARMTAVPSSDVQKRPIAGQTSNVFGLRKNKTSETLALELESATPPRVHLVLTRLFGKALFILPSLLRRTNHIRHRLDQITNRRSFFRITMGHIYFLRRDTRANHLVLFQNQTSFGRLVGEPISPKLVLFCCQRVNWNLQRNDSF